MAILHQLKLLTVDDLWKMVWKIFFPAFFAGFNPSLTYIAMVRTALVAIQCSYSSQASEGYKLKAECFFLICLELHFALYYCNFWHIFI